MGMEYSSKRGKSKVNKYTFICKKCNTHWQSTSYNSHCPLCSLEKERNVTIMETNTEVRLIDEFDSLSGELNVFFQGSLCHFIRFADCNLRCNYCDTNLTLPAYTKKIEYFHTDLNVVCITGGEPLLQKEAVKELVHHLTARGKNVYVETNGTIPWNELKCSCVVDYKLEYPELMIPDYWKKVRNYDFVNIVVSSENDFPALEEAYTLFKTKSARHATFCIGLTNPERDTQKLIDFCKVNEMYDALINIQIHKLLKIK